MFTIITETSKNDVTSKAGLDIILLTLEVREFW